MRHTWILATLALMAAPAFAADPAGSTLDSNAAVDSILTQVLNHIQYTQNDEIDLDLGTQYKTAVGMIKVKSHAYWDNAPVQFDPTTGKPQAQSLVPYLVARTQGLMGDITVNEKSGTQAADTDKWDSTLNFSRLVKDPKTGVVHNEKFLRIDVTLGGKTQASLLIKSISFNGQDIINSDRSKPMLMWGSCDLQYSLAAISKAKDQSYNYQAPTPQKGDCPYELKFDKAKNRWDASLRLRMKAAAQDRDVGHPNQGPVVDDPNAAANQDSNHQ